MACKVKYSIILVRVTPSCLNGSRPFLKDIIFMILLATMFSFMTTYIAMHDIRQIMHQLDVHDILNFILHS